MTSIQNDVIGGFNKFLADQKAEPGEARITYTQFDSFYEVVYQGIDIQKAPELTGDTFVPRGMTALYDAIGKTLNDQGKRIHDQAWAELVVVCVITDGDENSSHEYTQERVKEMTAHAESKGWKFIFLAANQDAFAASQKIGSSGQYSGNFAASAVGVASAYGATSATMSCLRSARDPGQLVSN